MVKYIFKILDGTGAAIGFGDIVFIHKYTVSKIKLLSKCL